MSNLSITPSTSIARINIRFQYHDTVTNSDKELVWDSTTQPDYIISMNHVIRATGQANELTLQLTHYIDPYESNNTPSYTQASVKNETDIDYIMGVISGTYGYIYFQYGYVQDKTNTSLNSVINSATTDDNTWFKMYITDLKSTFDTNQINYTLNAVSTLVSSVDLYGSYSYDWWADPEYKVGGMIGSTALTNNTRYNATVSPETVDIKTYYNRIKDIITYIIEHPVEASSDLSGYKVTFADEFSTSELMSSVTLKSNGNIDASLLTQTLGVSSISFIDDLLSLLVLQKRIYSPISYTNKSGDEVTAAYYYEVYRGWTLMLSDDEHNLNANVNWMYKDITNISIDYSNTEGYQVIKTEINNKGYGLGSLIYGFPSFDRDIFQNKTINSNTLFMLNPIFKELNPSVASYSYEVLSDIISINLDFPVMAGLAGAYSEMKSGTVDDTGTLQSTVTDYKTPNGGYNSGTIFNYLSNSEKSFKSILNHLYVEGDVTVPGVGHVLTMLGKINIFIFISNQLHLNSGQYILMGQTDVIQNSQYTTTFDVIKYGGFDNQNIYETDITTKTEG